MVHRAQDTRLLIALVKAEKDYAACLTGLLNASQTSFAALAAYGASCPSGQAKTVINVIGALSGAEDALRKYAGVVDGWRGDLKLVKKAEDEVASILRDREILVGRLVKASSKRTSRDSVLGMSLSPPSTTVQDPNTSTATPGNTPAGGGNVKLGHAQAELQACEAHLVLKEQELERVRVKAVIGGLRRRCTALVECGWIWGEKGKEALRTLETSSLNLNDDEKLPKGLAKLRRAAKSPVASDLSSVTPSQSASQILPGSDSSADPSNRPVLEEPKGSFSIDIPAAHSIDDHDAVHDNIPSSRLVVNDVRQRAESSDSDEGGKIEVHENTPFAHPPRNTSPRISEKRYMLTRHPSTGTGTTIKPASVLRVPSSHQSHAHLHKSKPVSDIGPVSVFKPGEAVGMPHARTATSSHSLLGTITGLFKGRRASVDHGAVYTGPTAVSFANGWPTRTDRNLVRSRAHLSSSEEDLPSRVKRRSRASGGKDELTPTPSRMGHSPDKGKGRAAQLAIPSSTSATIYSPKMSLERSSSSRSRETAANTALNARTNGGGSVHDGQHASVGRSESKKSVMSNGSASRRRSEPQPSSSLNMGEVTRQSGGGRSSGVGSSSGGGLVLPPAKFEVVRAPPSVTQAPVLISPSPSPLVLPSARKATGSRGAPTPPPRHGTGDTGVSSLPAPTSPRRGAPYTKTANGGSPRPLKPALRVPSLSPSPSPAPAIHGSVGSSTPSSSGTPTMRSSAVRLPEIRAPIPRPLPPTSMPLGVLPRLNRLSDIPASNRTSIVSENEYESCVEDFGDAEEGTESDTPPAALSPPLPASEKPMQSPPGGEPQKLLPPPRIMANGSPPVDASVSSTSTQGGKKSVRVIIHPTVTVSAPEEYTEPPTPPAYDKGKEYEWYKSHSRSTSGSGTSNRSEVSRSAAPPAWETRVEHQRSVWDNSEPEDEGYRAAKSALQRASAL